MVIKVKNENVENFRDGLRAIGTGTEKVVNINDVKFEFNKLHITSFSNGTVMLQGSWDNSTIKKDVFDYLIKNNS